MYLWLQLLLYSLLSRVRETLASYVNAILNPSESLYANGIGCSKLFQDSLIETVEEKRGVQRGMLW
jgi:hypothetical protein